MRRLTLVVTIAACTAAGAVAGCATSGFGEGHVTAPGKPEAEGDATFTWRAAADATRGTIRAVLPDGRVFAGEFLQVTTTTQGEELGSYWGGPYGWAHAGPHADDYSTFVRYYSGRVLAELEGPSGEHMRCHFQLAEPERGPQSGGIGDCEISSGERIGHATLRGEEED